MENVSPSSAPPYQVVDLVSHHLDAQTSLATASCVSKSWSTCLSSDHLWQPICSAAFPSLFHLRSSATPVSYHKLYSLGRVAQNRRLQNLTKPHLSLHDLVFAFDIQNVHGCVKTVILPVSQLKLDRINNQGLNGDIFRFHIDMKSHSVSFNGLEDLRITWNVVLQGYKSTFMMMDCSGKRTFVLGMERWFTKELPPAGCCLSGGESEMVADLRVGMKESGGKMVMEMMSAGVLNIATWRYALLDDTLRYLQHFLLPY